ncbi:hypothetical protein QYE76_059555 [Lolium multiflorum]|uniref:Uncharacterized protein n=1 Tax=Lolium multiflorum TaxID=4521 RepID=A0AAD8W4K9_LOLMU|nr:hypothetical protein QYE76_059555 [Lolium multiflorum]
MGTSAAAPSRAYGCRRSFPSRRRSFPSRCRCSFPSRRRRSFPSRRRRSFPSRRRRCFPSRRRCSFPHRPPLLLPVPARIVEGARRGRGLEGISTLRSPKKASLCRKSVALSWLIKRWLETVTTVGVSITSTRLSVQDSSEKRIDAVAVTVDVADHLAHGGMVAALGESQLLEHLLELGG